MFGRENYSGYVIDLIAETIAVAVATTIYFVTGSLYIGVCVYIHSMVADMKAELNDPAFESNLDQTARLPIIVKEIYFHNEIIAYA